MSQAEPVYTISLAAYDQASLSLTQAVAILHCVSCASDPANQNTTPRGIVEDALDGVISMVERAQALLHRP